MLVYENVISYTLMVNQLTHKRGLNHRQQAFTGLDHKIHTQRKAPAEFIFLYYKDPTPSVWGAFFSYMLKNLSDFWHPEKLVFLGFLKYAAWR